MKLKYFGYCILIAMVISGFLVISSLTTDSNVYLLFALFVFIISFVFIGSTIFYCFKEIDICDNNIRMLDREIEELNRKNKK